jgi:nitroreductase
MEFKELVHRRYSVRNYKSKPVEDEKLNAVLNAARLAPTAANKQPFRLIVIRTEGREEELKRIYHAKWFSDAPLVICACTVPTESWTRKDGRNYVDVDTAIAMDHLILSATDMGLGTCWIAAFDPKTAKRVLKLPDGVEPLLFTPLGYPADEISTKNRKEIDEIVLYEHW